MITILKIKLGFVHWATELISVHLETLGTELSDISMCSLHTLHNTFEEGHEKTGWHLDKWYNARNSFCNALAAGRISQKSQALTFYKWQPYFKFLKFSACNKVMGHRTSLQRKACRSEKNALWQNVPGWAPHGSQSMFQDDSLLSRDWHCHLSAFM